MTKDTITITALRLFLLRGYKNVSLVDVANELGITKGGIYHYFGSKEDLLHIAIQYMFDRFGAKYIELLGSECGFRENLQAILLERKLDHYIEQLLGIQPGDYRANQASLALEVMHNFPEFQERMDRSHLQFHGVIEQKLRKAQETGEIRQDIAAGSLATMLLAILSGQNVLGKELNTPSIRHEMMDSLWKLIAV